MEQEQKKARKKKKGKVFVIIAVVLVILIVLFSRCGDSGSGNDDKGQVGTTTEKPTVSSNQKEETPVQKPKEKKTVFYVGDTLEANELEIVYVASGDYISDNQFIQPAEGNKYIFLEFAARSVAKKGEKGITYYDFKAYADGYSAEALYSPDNNLSATLSPGRTTEGKIYFEVPENAKDIEVEYTINIFTEEKVKFIFEGTKDSGYQMEASSDSSKDAIKVGEITESKDLTVSYLACYEDTSYSQYSAPEQGYHYITCEFEFENKGNEDEHVSYFSFHCYADGKACDGAFFRDDGISATISAGRKEKGTVTFIVPDNATAVEVEYPIDSWNGTIATFSVK